jgi:hypothetical protein
MFFKMKRSKKPMADLYHILAEHHIDYERIDHPPVYTVEDVKRLVPPLPAAKTKNLFFRDHKGKRHFLVISNANLKRFLAVTGHDVRTLAVPSQKE